MIPMYSYVVVVNNRIFNYYRCFFEAVYTAAKLSDNGGSVTVEDMKGDILKFYNPSHKGQLCKQHSL